MDFEAALNASKRIEIPSADSGTRNVCFIDGIEQVVADKPFTSPLVAHETMEADIPVPDPTRDKCPSRT